MPFAKLFASMKATKDSGAAEGAVLSRTKIFTFDKNKYEDTEQKKVKFEVRTIFF